MAKKSRMQRREELEQSMQQAPLTEEETEVVDLEDASEHGADQPAAEQQVPQESPDDALAQAVAKQEEYLSMAQRVQADFENYRRRNQNVRKEAFDEGARAFATTLLPVIDNLERAIGAATDSADTSLKEGVEMVYRQLSDAFEKRGITVIDRMGETFDPNLENAVMQGTPDEGEPGTVCEVFQKGYQMDGMVLRHAMVKVVPE